MSPKLTAAQSTRVHSKRELTKMADRITFFESFAGKNGQSQKLFAQHVPRYEKSIVPFFFAAKQPCFEILQHADEKAGPNWPPQVAPSGHIL